MRIFKFALTVVYLLELSNCGVEAQGEEEVIRIEEFPINDRESFDIEYQKEESQNPEVRFIKLHFPTGETIMSHGAYIFFLQEYLQNHFYKFTKDERTILKTVKEDYLTMAVSYLQEYKKKEEEYGLEQAYSDIIHGEFLHYLHDLIDHGGPVDEGFDADENDDYLPDL